jgi:uncharacterized protein YjbI with pentapeptide repeats
LTFANLSNADLTGAILIGTSLTYAELRGADLTGAELYGADLRGANLSGAKGWIEEQLEQAESLEGATMPDGRVLKGDRSPHGPTFEEWRKSKDRKENGKSGGSS